MLDLIVRTYALALPEPDEAEARRVVDAAVERARGKHRDFDRFLPGIEALSGVFFTSHTRIPLDDYLETLYCSVKHGDFTKSWRAELKKPAVSGPPVKPLRGMVH
jgi:hypothetical protein